MENNKTGVSEYFSRDLRAQASAMIRSEAKENNWRRARLLDYSIRITVSGNVTLLAHGELPGGSRFSTTMAI